MPQDLLKVTASLGGAPFSEVQVNGRSFLKGPVTILTEGVHNKKLWTIQEMADSLPDWDGTPIVIDHPAGDSSEIWDSHLIQSAIGHLENPHVTERPGIECDALLELPPKTEEARAVCEAARKGEKQEVSIGAFAWPVEEAGEFRGETYIARPTLITPHHLAIVKRGACSLDDGCGLGQINTLSSARRPSFSGTERRSWSQVDKSLSAFIRGANRALGTDVEAGTNVSDLPSRVKRWIASKSLLGDPQADDFNNLRFFPVVNPGNNNLNLGALLAVMAGRGAQAQISRAALGSAREQADRLRERHFSTRQSNEFGDLEDRLFMVRSAIFDRFAREDNFPEIRIVEEDHAVFEQDGKAFRVSVRFVEEDDSVSVEVGDAQEVQVAVNPVANQEDGVIARLCHKLTDFLDRRAKVMTKEERIQKLKERFALCDEDAKAMDERLGEEMALKVVQAEVSPDSKGDKDDAKDKDKTAPKATEPEPVKPAKLTREQIAEALGKDHLEYLDAQVNARKAEREKIVAGAKKAGLSDEEIAATPVEVLKRLIPDEEPKRGALDYLGSVTYAPTLTDEDEEKAFQEELHKPCPIPLKKVS